MKKILLIGFSLILTVFVTRVFWHEGLPITHDSENHLARFANYKQALKERQFPPRFAPNLLNHYGYPVFNYNYPLANILSVPFSVLKVPYETTYKLLVFASVLGGVTGIAVLSGLIGISLPGRLLSMAAFASQPYLLNSIVVRGNIGEVMAISLAPWLLVVVEKYWQTYNQPLNQSRFSNSFTRFAWAVGVYTAFFLSHNVAVLLVMPIVLTYAVIRFKTEASLWLKYILTLGWATLNTLWFWLPALLEKNEVVLDRANLSVKFAEHFPTFHQLLFSPLQNGFSYAGSIDSLSPALGIVNWFGVMIASIFVLNILFKKSVVKYQTFFFWCITLTTLLVVLHLNISLPLWETIPLLRFAQFPWRLSLVLTLIMPFLIGLVFEASSSSGKKLLILVAFIHFVVLSRFVPTAFFHKTNAEYDQFSQTTSTLNENLPTTFTYLHISDWQPTPTILEGEGHITVLYWKGSDREYELTISTPSLVVEPTMYFLGWQTEVTPMNESTSKAAKVSYINTETIAGRLAYKVEPGRYVVRSRFTQFTTARLIGNTVSLVGLLGLGSLVIVGSTFMRTSSKGREVAQS